MSGKIDEAKDAHRQALSLLGAPAATAASRPDVRLELARTYYLLGVRVPANPGMRPPAPDGGRPPPRPSSREGDRPVPPVGPGEPPPRPGLRPGGPFGQDGGLGPPGDLEARRKYLDQAIVLLKGLLQDQPSSPPCRHLLALCCREMSPRGGQAGQTAYDNAVDILTGLAKDFPQALDYQFDLCETYAAVDSRGPLPKREDLTRVEARLRKALEISRELLRQQPKVPEYLASQSHIYHKLGEVTRRMRRPDDAEQYDRKAVEMQAALAKEFPEVTTYQVWLAAFRNSLADTLILRGNLNGARPLLETSISQTERLLQDNPTMWYLHALLMDANRLLASVLQQTKESDLAAKATRAAEDHSRKLHPGAK